MATSVDHLYRRGAVYWWHARVPVRLRHLGRTRVARSLLTRAFPLARSRARRCSAAFDRAMVALMEHPSPTAEQLTQVLDDIFRRILSDGERNRAARTIDDMPEWTPDPADDPRYEGLEPEEWDQVPYPPERWQEEWREAVMMNRQQDVEPLLADALSTRQLDMPAGSLARRQIARLALIVAAQAHMIDARREHGDYSDGWPRSAGMPLEEMPAAVASDSGATRTLLEPQAESESRPGRQTPTISVMFDQLFLARTDWNDDYKRQARTALLKFTSLMGDFCVHEIDHAITETFRSRMEEMPGYYGRSIYAGRTASDAVVTRKRALEALKAEGPNVRFGGKLLAREKLQAATDLVSKTTINRDLTIFTSWMEWMQGSDSRKSMLAEGKAPFSRLMYPKGVIRKERRLSGRTRRSYAHDELRTVFSSPLFRGQALELANPQPVDDLEHAKRWAILIAFHTGMRLGEIALLRKEDFKQDRKTAIWYMDLSSDEKRSFKTEAGDRIIPLHETLLSLGLHTMAIGSVRAPRMQLFTGMRSRGRQQGGNISRWYTDWRRELGIGGKDKPFHASRKTVITTIKANFEGSDDVIDQVMGHEAQTTSGLNYTDPLPIASKRKVIDAIDYDLDIPALLGGFSTPLNDVAGT